MKRSNSELKVDFMTNVVIDGVDSIVACVCVNKNYSTTVDGNFIRPKSNLNDNEDQVEIMFELTDGENNQLAELLSQFWVNRRHDLFSESSNNTDNTLSPRSIETVLKTVDPKCREPYIVPARKLLNDLKNSNPDDSKSNNKEQACSYTNGAIVCSDLARREYIYCDRHLQLVTKKYKRNKELKRSKSSPDSEFIDYSELIIGADAL